MDFIRRSISQMGAKAGKLALAGVMAVGLAPGFAYAQDLVADGGATLAAQAQATTYDYAGGYDLAKVTDGTIMWPDGKWVDTGVEGTYAWKTYVKGDNSHYGHYDATITFTVEDDVLTAIDMTSEGTTFGGKWGTLTPHSGSFVVGYLPEGVSDKTDITKADDGSYAVTPNLDGVATYGGSSIEGLAVYKVTASGEKTEIGTIAKKTSGRGKNATTTWEATPADGYAPDFASFDASTGVLTVKDATANMVQVQQKIGDYYVFGQYYGLDATGVAGANAATAAEKTDMAVEPTGIGAKDRDVYTAAAFALIMQREVPSWLVAMNDENAKGEIEDLDIISAATKSSDAVIESLYATQGYSYPVSNHDDATAAKASWEPIFSSVSPELAITMDGKTLEGDATTATRTESRQYQLDNALFGDDIAIAGFDLYSISEDMTTADLWSLGKGSQKESAVGAYMTNYISATGHGLVGTYGKMDAKQGMRDSEAGEDVLSDDRMTYDPETKVLTVKDPTVTHVVVQYAVGKFSDSNGGVCGVVYDLDDLYSDVMYRLYNPNSGEHFYTASVQERDAVEAAGWTYEGEAWTAPKTSASPVYRLYSGTDHHYTTNAEERDWLVGLGWSDEGIGWYSEDAKDSVLYRQFNPNVNPKASRNNSGSHNYTTSTDERDWLVSLGWHDEGIAWYGVTTVKEALKAAAAAAGAGA